MWSSWRISSPTSVWRDSASFSNFFFSSRVTVTGMRALRFFMTDSRYTGAHAVSSEIDRRENISAEILRGRGAYVGLVADSVERQGRLGQVLNLRLRLGRAICDVERFAQMVAGDSGRQYAVYRTACYGWSPRIGGGVRLQRDPLPRAAAPRRSSRYPRAMEWPCVAFLLAARDGRGTRPADLDFRKEAVAMGG